MSTPQTTSRSKAQFWSEHIKAWSGSTLTQQRYCQQHQLVYTRFLYWRSRLKQTARESGGANAVRFLPVAVKQKEREPLLLHIHEHCKIEIAQGFDPELLSQLIRTVRDAV